MRPPAPSLRPAVALPLLPASALGLALIWAAHAPAPARAPAPVAAPPSPQPKDHPLGPTIAYWSDDIHRWTTAHGLPADLVAVVITLESCGDPTAVSRAGALGLFQVMPFHFTADEDPLEVEVNAARGLAYLRRGLTLAQGAPDLALAGYNGGHGLIGRDPSTWPSETIRYVRWGTGILADLRSGRDPSPTHQAWLDAGGAALCRQAEARLSAGP